MQTRAKSLIPLWRRRNAVLQGTGRVARSRFLSGLLTCGLVLLGLAAAASRSDERGQEPSFARIDQEVQAIKQEILDINRDLSSLEEELLYPLEHRLTVFLSLSSGTTMDLKVLRIHLGEDTLVHHEYSNAEMDALRKGGVHKAYIGSIRKGEHVLQAQLRGKGRKDRVFDIVNGTTFTKRQSAKYVELRVSESSLARVPRLTIQSW
jgi:hypothetical protein